MSLDDSISAPSQSNIQISREISIKAPPFYSEKPALWFAQLESQFRMRSILTEVDKFHVVVPLIDTRSASTVEDIILAPPITNPYRELKEALIARFSKSKEANLIQLLDGECLGDKTPSQHLRHLRSLVPDIDEEVLKARWLSHLPPQMRACLVIQEQADLNKLGAAADKLHEVIKPAAIAAVSDLETQVAALAEHLAELSAIVARSRERTVRQRPRSRSRSRVLPATSSGGLCWYHAKFGANAQKCTTGCKYEENFNRSR
ncbi:uncharacterized protein LOC125775294 [Bactrocera dorsalis]|uniref:Uncharacterized protein LOC125775294 n=1 Tax=Bactrocera dorsalis TaxID=27457 RepID=A0ABM3JHK9_BACDO|nr:uncharacterized protein LOC125775294 [Bactrocera dorsalis]